ncbi:hypothetical protein C8J57DRAFT_1380319 [Mycena rebaudengoi]|nr:hypothetical protein C8J57DRAFT_1380319 [Mycena rebaudengoi]
MPPMTAGNVYPGGTNAVLRDQVKNLNTLQEKTAKQRDALRYDLNEALFQIRCLKNRCEGAESQCEDLRGHLMDALAATKRDRAALNVEKEAFKKEERFELERQSARAAKAVEQQAISKSLKRTTDTLQAAVSELDANDENKPSTSKRPRPSSNRAGN